MSMSGMNLVELEPNVFEDVDTKTTFQFWFNYELTLKEADKRIYAHYRWWKEVCPKDQFYGRYHPIIQTGDASGQPGFGDYDS